MVVLQLWSDDHRRTPVDIFVEEPFPFSEEATRAVLLDLENLENPSSNG